MPRVVCVGETMVLVVPADGKPLDRSADVQLAQAGAESNVAVGLAALGTTASWASRVGDDPLGRRVVAELVQRGVDVGLVETDPTRPTGVMFKDPGPERSTVYYYRAGSAASALDGPDADRIVQASPGWVHTSGVTTALSTTSRRLVLTILDRALEHGIPVSFDVNYRPRLWPDRDTAVEYITEAADRAHVVFVGLDEAEELWGAQSLGAIRSLLPGPEIIVVKDGSRFAACIDRSATTVVPAPVVDVVEPVGAGDAFAAGWIHAHLNGADPRTALRLGHLVAGAALRSRDDHGAIERDVLISRASDDLYWTEIERSQEFAPYGR